MSTTNAIKKVLESNFNNAIHEEFWHYMAKYNFKVETYEKETIDKRVEDIRKQLGTCSFNSQGVNGWTPLHVAVLSGNKAATSFLITRGALISIRDKSGKTPADYSGDFPEIKKLFDELKNTNLEKLFPQQDDFFSDIVRNYALYPKDSARDPDSYKLKFYSFPPDLEKAKKVLGSLLPPVIPLPTSSFTYQENTNDFGLEIKQLLVASSPPKQLSLDHVLQNLSEVAKIEGFELSPTKEWHYPRDAFVWTTSGVTTFTSNTDQLDKALERAASKAAYFEESTAYRASVICLASPIGCSRSEKQFKDVPSFSTFYKAKLPVYLEGGNLLTLTNPNRRRKVLMGKDHLAQIHTQLRLQKFFDLNPPPALKETLSNDEIRRLAEEMYSMGLLKTTLGQKEQTGFISQELISEVLSESYGSNKTFREVAIQKGLEKFVLKDEELEKAKPYVMKYAAQQKTVKGKLALEMGILDGDLHFIQQVAVHLDTFMQPGPKGSIFLQDFALCAKILKQLKEFNNFRELRLCPDDHFMLHRYLATAEHLQEKVGPLLVEAKAELEKAGFVVIPTPGVFYDQHYDLGDKTYHINFLNAVTGWSEKQKHYFYITLGASSGTWLGQQLMQLFSMFIQQYQPGLAIHFVGENPKTKGDFSQGMQLWNQVQSDNNSGLTLGALAGVHCLTFEKQAKSHKANE